ncbi:MAG: membrane protein insertase YidC [Candidatus Poribacteria bacterium]|nr:membrane protein insertase YidC [Candidatus Poribacteria bacterium]
MEKRYILAIVLMALVMFGWSYWFGRNLPKPDRPKTTEQSSEAPPSPWDEPAIGQSRSTQPAESTRNQQKIQQGAEIQVHTENYAITFIEELAIAQRWVLKKYPNRSGRGEPSMNLIPATAQNCLSVRFFDPQLQLDAVGTTWKADKRELVLTDQNPQDTLTFSKQIGDNLKVFKTLTFYRDSYYADLELTFQNLSDQRLVSFDATTDNPNGYKLLWGPGIEADLLAHEYKSGKRGRYNPKNDGAKAYTGFGKAVKELGESQLTETVLWAGVNSKYFAALMIPDPSLEAGYQRESLKDNGETPAFDIAAPSEAASLIRPGFSLPPRKSQADLFRIYVGPKDNEILKTVEAPGNSAVSPRLTKIIDFGFFWFIAWPMLWLLNGFHRILRNYGIAIILLTLLTKLISYPLTRKSYKSMKEMQNLQPLLTELREKYRDDPQRLNKATMQLYKEHGVNPLGGCIPWLPQIPIFWALFALLGNSVELRGAPFFLWIDDLAAPDALFMLPFTIPFLGIDAFRILPLVNGLTTWLQQRMTSGMTPMTNSTQAKIMQFMPLMFVFLFYNWASGFVLYWLCNNVFTIGQQYLTQSKKSDQTEPAKTLPAKKQSQPKKRKPSTVKRNA